MERRLPTKTLEAVTGPTDDNINEDKKISTVQGYIINLIILF